MRSHLINDCLSVYRTIHLVNHKILIFILFFFFSEFQICDNIMLPNLDIDDIMVFEDMGAYTIPIASAFNGFPLPKIEYFIQRKHL